MVKCYVFKILPQILSRRDNSSVKAIAQLRSVQDGTAGVKVMGMFYRSGVPDGTFRGDQA